MGNYSKRNFNPFNLNSEQPNRTKRIKFDRFPTKIKTKPVWWFIMAFIFVIIIYWYLNFNSS